MSFYMIGLGLNDEKDISVRGLEIVKKAKKVFLETYTSKLQCSTIDLEKFYGRKIILADREMVENKSDEILEDGNAFLVIGDVFSATTHIDLLLRAKEKKLKVEVLNNSSVLTAVGITGLELYKFGRVISIPRENTNIDSPYKYFLENERIGLHTLFLLDVAPEFMTCREALDYLIKKGLDKKRKAVCCSALGSEKQEIKYGTAEKVSVKGEPQCLIIPGRLHFKEEEALSLYGK